GRLAAAGRAQHTQEFAGLNIERDIGESFYAVCKDLRDTANADKLHQADGRGRSGGAGHTAIGRPSRAARLAGSALRSVTFLKGSTRPARTPNTASPSRYLSSSGKNSVISGLLPGALFFYFRCAGPARIGPRA